jgi:hypothetical protein
MIGKLFGFGGDKKKAQEAPKTKAQKAPKKATTEAPRLTWTLGRVMDTPASPSGNRQTSGNQNQPSGKRPGDGGTAGEATKK